MVLASSGFWEGIFHLTDPWQTLMVFGSRFGAVAIADEIDDALTRLFLRLQVGAPSFIHFPISCIFQYQTFSLTGGDPVD